MMALHLIVTVRWHITWAEVIRQFISLGFFLSLWRHNLNALAWHIILNANKCSLYRKVQGHKPRWANWNIIAPSFVAATLRQTTTNTPIKSKIKVIEEQEAEHEGEAEAEED